MYSRILTKFLCRNTKINVLTRSIGKITLEDCPKPLPPMNIALIGGNSDIGQITALLLKQYHVLCKINLFDCEDTTQVACGLNQINSITKIVPYSGLKNLECALCDARIVLICGCNQTKPDSSEKYLFKKNAARVRQVIMYCTEFAPKATVIIATPPVSSLVPMAVEEFRKADIFAERRVFGFVKSFVTRTKALAGEHLKVNPYTLNALVVGGGHRRTCIPVLSHMKEAAKMKLTENEMLTRAIQEGEEDVLYEKYFDKNNQGCYLSTGLAIAKFVISVAKGLGGYSKAMECAYVKQEEPLSKFAKYLTTLVKFGKHGIESSYLPKLSKHERNRLNMVAEDIRYNIYLGESYITGDERCMRKHRPKKTQEKAKAIQCLEIEKPQKPKKDPCKKVPLRSMKLVQ